MSLSAALGQALVAALHGHPLRLGGGRIRRSTARHWTWRSQTRPSTRPPEKLPVNLALVAAEGGEGDGAVRREVSSRRLKGRLHFFDQ